MPIARDFAADNGQSGHVLIQGNPVEGYTIHGPFETAEDAAEAGDRTRDKDWWIAPLWTPEPA